MKGVLKYLFPVIAVLAFWNCMGASASAVTEDESSAVSLAYAAYQADISETRSELCLPRQVSFANSQRVQTTVQRTAGAGRNNIEFTKSGKVINADIRYFTQRKSILIHFSLIEPALKLIYLCKLII